MTQEQNQKLREVLRAFAVNADDRHTASIPPLTTDRAVAEITAIFGADSARLDKIRSILFAYGEENDGTSDPWWCVVAKNRMGAQSILAGPFFSRERAEEHRKAREYDYGKGSIVWCFSGHRSQHYKELRSAIDAAPEREK